MRLGVLDSGLHAANAFGTLTPNADILYTPSVTPKKLWLYDVIVVPLHTDQVFLMKQNEFFKSYLDSGGVLVLLGATSEREKWVPFYETDWERRFTELIEIDHGSDDGKIVFDKIVSVADLHYHSKYYAHGSFRKTVFDGVNYLATDAGEGTAAVMFVRRFPHQNTRGTLFVTTLDPDYHSVVDVPGPAEEQAEKTHNKAAHLLRNIVRWAETEARTERCMRARAQNRKVGDNGVSGLWQLLLRRK